MHDRDLPYEGARLRALMKQRRAPGQLVWIGVRLEHGAPMRTSSEAQLLEERGLVGDLASAGSGGKRQVSLLQAEHLPVIAALVGADAIDPALLRRNLIVRGINLHALRATCFRIGEVVFEGSGTCEPCSKMERALGVGGYNALRGHGGILARVKRAGVIRLRDEVDFYVDARGSTREQDIEARGSAREQNPDE